MVAGLHSVASSSSMLTSKVAGRLQRRQQWVRHREPRLSQLGRPLNGGAWTPPSQEAGRMRRRSGEGDGGEKGKNSGGEGEGWQVKVRCWAGGAAHAVAGLAPGPLPSVDSGHGRIARRPPEALRLRSEAHCGGRHPSQSSHHILAPVVLVHYTSAYGAENGMLARRAGQRTAVEARHDGLRCAFAVFRVERWTSGKRVGGPARALLYHPRHLRVSPSSALSTTPPSSPTIHPLQESSALAPTNCSLPGVTFPPPLLLFIARHVAVLFPARPPLSTGRQPERLHGPLHPFFVHPVLYSAHFR